jgi:3-methyladenine DNA glycosylase AlkD
MARSAECEQVLALLRRKGTAKGVAGMARYGISGRVVYGVSGPNIKQIARAHRRDHALAVELRRSGVFEARALAALVEDPKALTPSDMDRWAREFESWADCDSACLQLFWKAPCAFEKAQLWSRKREEIVRRAGFAMMAALAVHDKQAPDARFVPFLRRIEATAGDDRNLVKKAVNWALRQIGKRNVKLNREAIRTAKAIARQGTPSARWVASDALRELQSAKVRERLAKRG